jgi:hypothetical protein
MLKEQIKNYLGVRGISLALIMETGQTDNRAVWKTGE